MAFLLLQRLCKAFPGQAPVLRDINLAVERNECLVVLGPSGCGKTTTLRLIAGLETATSGEIFLSGRNISREPPWSRGAALVFQRPSLLPHWLVRDHLGSASSGDGAATALISEALEIDGLMSRKAGELSGGEKQRVVLARALLSRSRLLLMDEPLAHLDVPVKRKLWQELGLLRRRFPATIIYVTHDPAEALALGDRIAVLLDGVVQQADTAARLRDQPAHRFVAEVFQDPDDPLNFLELPLDATGSSGFAEASDSPVETIAAIPASELLLEKWDPAKGAVPWQVMIRQAGLGGELCICERGKARVAVRVERGSDFQPGQRVMMKRAGQRVQWFDRATGRRVEAG